MIQSGDRAPDFELPSDTGETYELDGLRGQRVVLYFYPKDDTSGCTKEACGFRDALPSFDDRDAVVLGVSPDGLESHAEFRASYDLNFPLLADEEGRVARAYGVWSTKNLYGNEIEGVDRATFVIGPDGVVERDYDEVEPDGHAEEILSDLREIEG
jgi:peroxiredoxin Q/BCP